MDCKQSLGFGVVWVWIPPTLLSPIISRSACLSWELKCCEDHKDSRSWNPVCVQMPPWCQDPCFGSSHLPALEHLGREKVSTDVTRCLCAGVLCRGETWPVLQFRCWRTEQEWKHMPRGLSLLAMSRPPLACPARQKCVFMDLSLMSSLLIIYECVKSVDICAGMGVYT